MATQKLSLILNLGAGTVMGVVTVLIHFWGLIFLTFLMNQHGHRIRPHEGNARRAFALLVVVLGIFALHTVEIWAYALVYLGLGEVPDFESALYFSTVAFTTVGFGDIVMSPRWRVLSAIEAANGWILFAWSTAFLLTVTTRMKLLEHDWLEPRA